MDNFKLMVWDAAECAVSGALWALQCAAVVAVFLSPFALEWVADGCPVGERAWQLYADDVKGGW